VVSLAHGFVGQEVDADELEVLVNPIYMTGEGRPGGLPQRDGRRSGSGQGAGGRHRATSVTETADARGPQLHRVQG
jgi:hypothetical protein